MANSTATTPASSTVFVTLTPAQALAPLPAIPTFFKGASIKIPLVTAGTLESNLRKVYDILGIGTLVIAGSDANYSAPISRTVMADSVALEAHVAGVCVAIAASRRPSGPPLGHSTQSIQVINAMIPIHQAGSDMVGVYDALGINTVELVIAGEKHTVVAAEIASAVRHLEKSDVHACPSAPDGVHCGFGPRPGAASTPFHSKPIDGITLQDHYVGPPPAPVLALAKTFGIRFLRIRDDAGAVYWIPSGGLIPVEITAQRLGLEA